MSGGCDALYKLASVPTDVANSSATSLTPTSLARLARGSARWQASDGATHCPSSRTSPAGAVPRPLLANIALAGGFPPDILNPLGLGELTQCPHLPPHGSSPRGELGRQLPQPKGSGVEPTRVWPQNHSRSTEFVTQWRLHPKSARVQIIMSFGDEFSAGSPPPSPPRHRPEASP